MPILQNFPAAAQADPNSCWACAGREVVNWYSGLNQSGGQAYATDQAFADAWAVVSNDDEHGDIGVQQSAAAALADLGFDNNTDDAPVPSPEEITTAINDNMPLLAIVGDEEPNPSPNLDYQNGHWVVIVGIEQADEGYTLYVFDPATGQVDAVDYDEAQYEEGVYWQNTSYVDRHA